MSRIDDALKRITGVKAESRPVSGLDRYAPEVGYKPEERKAAAFVGAAPLPVDERQSAPQKIGAPMQRASASGDSGATAQPEAHGEPETERLIDFRPIADYLRFLGGAIRRHKFLAAATFLFAFALTVAAAMLMPRTYSIETKLLAQRNEVMTALSNPGRAVPWDADAPTRSAAETILRRDNLVNLIKQVDLVNDWQRTRIPILRFKDWARSFVRRPPTPDETLDGLVGLLEARMVVTAGPVGDGTVTIELDWPNAEMGFRLVEAAQQAFIEARQAAERAAIRESIGILEHYSATLHENINATLTELQKTQAQSRAGAGVSRTAIPRPRLSPTATVTSLLPPVPIAARDVPAIGADLNDPEIPRLKDSLTARRQEIATMEAERQRQLSELQGQLARMMTVYTPAHPSVLSLQQNIAALTRDSPQLAALKLQADGLETEHQKRIAAVAELQQIEQLKTEFSNRAQSAAQAPRQRILRVPGETTDPLPQTDAPGTREVSDFASIRLRLELNQLESVLERTDGARIELAVSDAAFKYRYNVIRPPQVPKDPKSPNFKLIVIAGLFGSILLALSATMVKDLLSDRIFERWQVERRLGLPVLGSLGAA
jgi:uncharacterized protein involved in exopolysaccharide biosynthesis